mmetsp:Transcript_4853/g.15376  ORF Transcript_4853/g.15376 Transcript_4853/m.15376 type:complete len:346 (-) Transcript_4853:889-1926(-)
MVHCPRARAAEITCAIRRETSEHGSEDREQGAHCSCKERRIASWIISSSVIWSSDGPAFPFAPPFALPVPLAPADGAPPPRPPPKRFANMGFGAPPEPAICCIICCTMGLLIISAICPGFSIMRCMAELLNMEPSPFGSCIMRCSSGLLSIWRIMSGFCNIAFICCWIIGLFRKADMSGILGIPPDMPPNIGKPPIPGAPAPGAPAGAGCAREPDSIWAMARSSASLPRTTLFQACSDASSSRIRSPLSTRSTKPSARRQSKDPGTSPRRLTSAGFSRLILRYFCSSGKSTTFETTFWSVLKAVRRALSGAWFILASATSSGSVDRAGAAEPAALSLRAEGLGTR